MSHTILVCDDDPGFLELIKTVLETQFSHQNGMPLYDVICVRTADEALRVFHAMEMDLVLVDARLDGQDGVALAHELEAINPAAKIAYVTGVAQEPNGGAKRTLFKPFALDELLNLVREMLNPPENPEMPANQP